MLRISWCSVIHRLGLATTMHCSICGHMLASDMALSPLHTCSARSRASSASTTALLVFRCVGTGGRGKGWRPVGTPLDTFLPGGEVASRGGPVGGAGARPLSASDSSWSPAPCAPAVAAAAAASTEGRTAGTEVEWGSMAAGGAATTVGGVSGSWGGGAGTAVRGGRRAMGGKMSLTRAFTAARLPQVEDWMARPARLSSPCRQTACQHAVPLHQVQTKQCVCSLGVLWLMQQYTLKQESPLLVTGIIVRYGDLT
jgi:hypothetical protein